MQFWTGLSRNREEEKNADDNIKRYDLFGNDPKSLYMLDNEMKAESTHLPHWYWIKSKIPTKKDFLTEVLFILNCRYRI